LRAEFLIFSILNFTVFGQQNNGSGTGFGYALIKNAGSESALKLMRINNTAENE
jgi:hypothetical protein